VLPRGRVSIVIREGYRRRREQAHPLLSARLRFSFDAGWGGNTADMLLLLLLLIVLIFAGAGFALHVLWIVAVIFALFWLIGAAIGRGETSGRHRFYRW